MKSLLVTLATSTVLTAAVLAAGQSLSLAGAGMILFASGVVSFAFADYSHRPRLALRVVAPVAPRPVRAVRVERESTVAALVRTASPFQTMSA